MTPATKTLFRACPAAGRGVGAGTSGQLTQSEDPTDLDYFGLDENTMATGAAVALESSYAAIETAWQEYQSTEIHGIALGKVLAEWRDANTNQGSHQGLGFVQVLHKVGIPRRTAYYWIERYEISIGTRPMQTCSECGYECQSEKKLVKHTRREHDERWQAWEANRQFDRDHPNWYQEHGCDGHDPMVELKADESFTADESFGNLEEHEAKAYIEGKIEEVVVKVPTIFDKPAPKFSLGFLPRKNENKEMDKTYEVWTPKLRFLCHGTGIEEVRSALKEKFPGAEVRRHAPYAICCGVPKNSQLHDGTNREIWMEHTSSGDYGQRSLYSSTKQLELACWNTSVALESLKILRKGFEAVAKKSIEVEGVDGLNNIKKTIGKMTKAIEQIEKLDFKIEVPKLAV